VDIVLIAMAIATLLAYLVTGAQRPQLAVHGLDASVEMFLQALPWIIVSMFAAGLLSQWFQPAVIARWLGRDSGVSGVVIGALLGMCGTGSRWAMYPLAAGLLTADASPGSVFAFVTTWQLVSLPRLPAELPFYGTEFAVIRAITSILLSIAGGIVINQFKI